MNVLFDISHLLNSEGGGIHYHLRGLLPALRDVLISQGCELDFVEFRFRSRRSALPEFIDEKHFRSFRFPVKLLNSLWLNLRIPDLGLFYENIDIVHSPHFSLPAFKTAKKVLTVHDITYLRHPEYFDPKHRKLNDYGYKTLLPANIRRADHIIAISEHTKNDVMDYFGISGDKITTIHTGVDKPSRIPAETAERYLDELDLKPRKYIFFPAGSLEPRKNIPLTIQAFTQATIPKDVKLVVSGVGNADSLGLTNARGTRFVKWKSESERDILYQNALFVVYPSLYEGFGMPVAEAMSNGKAVLTSNMTSLAEIADDDALTVDSRSIDELTAGFNKLIDASIRADYEQKSIAAAKRFSWETMAKKTLEVYERILS